MRLLVLITFMYCLPGSYVSVVASDTVRICKVYENYFPIGVAINSQIINDKVVSGLIKTHFKSVTAENAMKPSELLNNDGSYNWKQADEIVSFARNNNLRVRGHTLLWHKQTPEFFFKQNGKNVSRENLYKRLEIYMDSVLTHFKDDVYCWDVVNEAISAKEDDFFRKDSYWYQICGEEFVEKAFRLAHSIDSTKKLYYNDYDLINPVKRLKVYNLLKSLIDKGVPVHGVGIQAHWSIHHTDIGEVKKTIEAFASLGLEVQITELDLTVYRDKRTEKLILSKELEEKQAEKYKELFELFREKSEIIKGVTFWGLSDKHTWLDNHPFKNGPKDYPLLFDTEYSPKKAFYEIITIQ